jgi:hypothetical protein
MRAPTTAGSDLPAVQSRRLSFWARTVLIPVAVIGAVLSFDSLYAAATPTFGRYLGAGFPLLVDLLILGSSLQYVAGAKVGRPMAGWRLTAHAGVGATLILNALAAQHLGEVPWHVTAPAVWAVLVELTAKQVLGEWKATHATPTDEISFTLWMSTPMESARTRLLMLRTGLTDAHEARAAVGIHAAAREALRLALPSWRGRSVRKIINRQLRAGSLPPAAILAPLGWAAPPAVLPDSRPQTILRAVLHGVLDPATLHALTSQATTGDAQPDPAADVAAPPADEAREEAESRLAQTRAELAAQSEATAQQTERATRAEAHAAQLDTDVAGLHTTIAQLQADLTAQATATAEQTARAEAAEQALAQTRARDRRENHGTGGPSGTRRSETQLRRLNDAIDIIRRQPEITGPELKIELSGKGWKVSDRTATRILPTARSGASARGHLTLTAVGG